jgi:putative SOS response-associated peptidase YedK
MCGRYALKTSPDRLKAYFDLTDAGVFGHPRYNIAPSQDVPAVVAVEDERRLVTLSWGLLPSWAKDARMRYSTINARAETVDVKPAFRSAFRHRRCMIPASGFFEWQPVGDHKQPWYVHPPCDDDLYAFAGLWETWDRGAESIHSCTIIVCEANAAMRRIHDRMPVILAPADMGQWLDPIARAADLKALLRPCPDERIGLTSVSPWVNNPRHDDPACIHEAPYEG